MAPESYYFFFSIIAVLSTALFIANTLWFKFKGQTLIGTRYDPKSLEYKRFTKFSKTSTLVGATVALIIFIANLIFDIHRLIHLQDRSYVHFILVFAPVTSVLGLIAAIIYVAYTYGDKH